MSFVPIRKENMKTIACAVARARVEFIVCPQPVALRVGLCECLCSSMTFQSCGPGNPRGPLFCLMSGWSWRSRLQRFVCSLILNLGLEEGC
jgi:hypothetical protein